MIYRFGQYSLDPQGYELRRGEEVVKVEPQVFGLLTHLIENRDRVVSKDDLIEAVWGGRIVSDATISSRISAARQAVGDTGDAQAIIRTMPRRGFRFVANVAEMSAAAAEKPEETGSDDGLVQQEPHFGTSRFRLGGVHRIRSGNSKNSFSA